MKDAGIPTTNLEAAPKPIPDEQNAAFVYQEAFGLLDMTKKDEISEILSTGFDYSRFAEWNSEEKEKCFQTAKDHEAVYDLIKRATQLPACRLPRKYVGGRSRLDSLQISQMEILSRILIAQLLVGTDKGNLETAVDDFLSGIQLAEHLASEPILQASRARTEIIRDFLEALNGIFNQTDLDRAQLLRIFQKLENIPGRENLVTAIRGEAALREMPIFHRMRDSAGNFPYFAPLPSLHHRRVVYPPFSSHVCKKEFLVYLRLSEERILLVGKPYHEAKSVLKRDWSHVFNRMARRTAPAEAMFHSAYWNSLRFAYFEAWRGLGRIATALKLCKLEYGEYPEKLTDLVPKFIQQLPRDPFTGSEFVYHKQAKRFLLYSVGENGRDDGGKIYRPSRGHKYPDQWLDITWRQAF